jgi:hypothetical protein
MRLTWFLAVDLSTTRAAAISRLESSRAINLSILALATGQVVQSGAVGRPGVVCWAMRSTTRRATDGESSESPAALVCTAAMSSSGRVRLSTKPGGARPQGAEHVVVLLEGGEDEDLDLGRRVGQLAGDLGPVPSGMRTAISTTSGARRTASSAA